MHFRIPLAGMLLAAFFAAQTAAQSIIPSPRQLSVQDTGFFLLSEASGIVADTARGSRETALLLADFVQKSTGKKLPLLAQPKPRALYLAVKGGGPDESYHIDVEADKIRLEAADARGLVWAVQTLRQLPDSLGRLPLLSLTDAPTLGWRGGHLDVCRHFMSVEMGKKYIDILSFYKFNRFHWHLTDDQGWRIEIRKYPRLTQAGGWRTEPDGSRHGGFYTQSQIREVVAHATRRGIEVIPEIEMPGHAVAALAAYPHLGCTGGPYQVPNQFGVFDDVFCAGQESTFTFLEDVLREVVTLFPSEYVHIGGDEVPKTRWKACPHCQRRLSQLHLPDEHALQSYFIRRMEAFLKTKGKKTIGWDEILEGGISPTATVEVWRGLEQAHKAARNGNAFLLTSYFDAPPGTLTLRKVYDFEARPKAFSPKENSLLLGAEACVWTEYIPEYKLEPMILPRLAGLSEALWQGEGNDFQDFQKRLTAHYAFYEKQGWRYGPEDRDLYKATITYRPDQHDWLVSGQAGLPGVQSRRLQQGGHWQPWADTLVLTRPGTVQVQPFWGNRPFSEAYVFRVVENKALGKPVTLTALPDARYGHDRPMALTDGLLGDDTRHNDDRWLGWDKADVQATLDLGTPTSVQALSVRFMQRLGTWILLPVSLTWEVSANGTDWQVVGAPKANTPPTTTDLVLHDYAVKLPRPQQVRYVRLKAARQTLPAGHPGAGNPAWLFADEIVVR